MIFSNINWTRVICLIIPNLGGWIGSLAMINQVSNKDRNAWYQIIKKPKWTPPNYIFAPVWVIMYATMGLGFYLVYEACDGFTDKSTVPFTVYAVHLVLNWTWTFVFFRLHQLGWATFHIIILDFVVLGQTAYFFTFDHNTVYFVIPYIMWLAFATTLTAVVWKLNKDQMPIPNEPTKMQKFEGLRTFDYCTVKQ